MTRGYYTVVTDSGVLCLILAGYNDKQQPGQNLVYPLIKQDEQITYLYTIAFHFGFEKKCTKDEG